MPMRTYPSVYWIIGGVDYVPIDEADWMDALESNTVKFILVEP